MFISNFLNIIQIVRRDKGPPMALASAMGKDKKPFTYTPGGIDLSEIKSPRMAKRLQMNAASEGITSEPKPMAPEGQKVSTPLTPAAAAAMTPCMAVPVFPTGFPSAQSLHRTPGRSAPEFTPSSPQIQSPQTPPSPAPVKPPPVSSNSPPPSPIQTQGAPPPPPPPLQKQTSVQYQPVQFNPKPYTGNVNAPNSSCFGTNVSAPGNQPVTYLVNKVTTNGSALGNSMYTPAPPQPQQHVEQNVVYPESQSSSNGSMTRPTTQQPTKVQARSQNLESIYIPPIEHKLNGNSGYDDKNVEKKVDNNASSSSLASSRSNATIVIPTPPSSNATRSPWQGAGSTSSGGGSASPMTPQLNKAPIPWMNSSNRGQPNTPPYVTTPEGSSGNTPWGNSPIARTIPIAMDKGNVEAVQPQHSRTRSVPIQMPRDGNNEMTAGGPNMPIDGARSIPIQVSLGVC